MTKRYYPKVIFPFLNFIFASVSLWTFAYVIFKMASNPKKIEIVLSGFFFSTFIGFFSFHLFYQLFFYVKATKTDGGTISFFELKTLKTQKLSLSEIAGFSNSEVFFGKYTFKIKSLVIYPKTGKPIELLRNYVCNLSDLENHLKMNKIKYLGFEQFTTGWYFRKYSFDKVNAK